MAGYLINCIPDVATKRYLELGVFDSANFSTVLARDKTSVDNAHPATFQGTTDAFFAQLDPAAKWDVIYIDACHDYPNVLRDYNHSVRHLAEGGWLFLHDLVPPDEEHTKSWFCGDAYKLLHYLLRRPVAGSQIYVLDGDYGLTLIRQPRPANPAPVQAELSYADFRAYLADVRCYSRDEMETLIAQG